MDILVKTVSECSKEIFLSIFTLHVKMAKSYTTVNIKLSSRRQKTKPKIIFRR